MRRSVRVESWSFPGIDRAETLRYLGYAGQATSSDLDCRLDQARAEALAAAEPRGALAVFPVASREEGAVPAIHLEGTPLVLRGHDIAAHLEGADSAGIFAVTLGLAHERTLHRLSLTDSLGHVLFDAASVALVEQAADAAEAEMVRMAQEEGLACGWRFSPGYGDLPLATQPDLLAALDATKLLGISLSESLLMTPTKSVTAIVAIGADPASRSHTDCRSCVCHDVCTFRAQGRTCHERCR